MEYHIIEQHVDKYVTAYPGPRALIASAICWMGWSKTHSIGLKQYNNKPILKLVNCLNANCYQWRHFGIQITVYQVLSSSSSTLIGGIAGCRSRTNLYKNRGTTLLLSS